MQRMKLFAVPLLVRLLRQACDRKLFERPLRTVQARPGPFSIYRRITERTAVRSTDTFSIVGVLVLITMTLRASEQRSLARFEIGPVMFRMTSSAANPRRYVRLNDSRLTTASLVTGSAVRFHLPSKRMTVRAGIVVRFNRNWRVNSKPVRCMRLG